MALKRDYDNNMYWGYIQQQKLMRELILAIKENYNLK